MADARGAPCVDPLAGVPAEVDPAGGVADLQERSGDDGALGGDEGQAAVGVLAEAEEGDRAGLDVELHAHTPAALAVVDAQPAQQRVAGADGEVAGAVVAHLHHAVLEVQGLDLGERAAGAHALGGELGDAGAQFVLPAAGTPRAVSKEAPRIMPAPSRSWSSPPRPRW